MNPPEGYQRLESDGARVWVWRDARAWAETTLDRFDSLHSWAAELPDTRTLEGRGIVYDVPAAAPAPEGRRRWAVRHYFRGGMMASLLDDRYLRSPRAPRPFRELVSSATVRQRGIRTPAVVAGAVYPSGIFYRADLVTELVPGGVNLRDLLFGTPTKNPPPSSAPDPAESLRAAGRLVRRMESRGVYHPDLNAANILVTVEEPVRAHLLDLDRCRTRAATLAAPPGRMEARLERSLEKLEDVNGTALAPGLWDALRTGVRQDG